VVSMVVALYLVGRPDVAAATLDRK
jgi:hypothetical protein